MHPNSNASKGNNKNDLATLSSISLLYRKEETLCKCLSTPTDSHQTHRHLLSCVAGRSQFRQDKPLPGPVAAGCGLCVVRHQSDRESRIGQPPTLTDPTNGEKTKLTSNIWRAQAWSTRYLKKQRRHPPAMAAASTATVLASQALELDAANSKHLTVVVGRILGMYATNRPRHTLDGKEEARPADQNNGGQTTTPRLGDAVLADHLPV